MDNADVAVRRPAQQLDRRCATRCAWHWQDSEGRRAWSSPLRGVGRGRALRVRLRLPLTGADRRAAGNGRSHRRCRRLPPGEGWPLRSLPDRGRTSHAGTEAGPQVSARNPQRVPASTLVLDYNLYPRHKLDPVNLRTLNEALDAGEALPSVIADKTSKRVVDGFHRTTVALRRNVDVAVEWRTYKDDAAMFLDAVALNARHGVPLEPFDR